MMHEVLMKLSGQAVLDFRYTITNLNTITETLIKIARCWMRSVKGLLDYAIKIAATWVACKKLHARITRPFTLRIQHRAIF